MMNSGKTIEEMTTHERVRNAYESLYFNIDSGDEIMDEVYQTALLDSFTDYDTIFADCPDDKLIRNILVNSVIKSVNHVDGEINYRDVAEIEESYDTFAERYYNTPRYIFERFEERSNGMPADFASEYARILDENNGIHPDAPERYNAELDIIEKDPDYNPYMKFIGYSREEEIKMLDQESEVLDYLDRQREGSNLNYNNEVKEVEVVKRKTAKRTYSQKRMEEDAADDLKGSDFDKNYEAFARDHRKASFSKFTAADDYGFDEFIEDEDDLEF